MEDNEHTPVILRKISTTPRKDWKGHWKRGRLYPLYSVVENNGTRFMALTGKAKEEPFVIYDADNDKFIANEGWEIVYSSADSRISALGGSSQGETGPQGPQGPQGIQGEKGDTGEAGPAGINDGTFEVTCDPIGELSGTATVAGGKLSMSLNGIMETTKAVFLGDALETV